MQTSLFNSAPSQTEESVSVNALRGQVLQRLDAVQRRLEGKGVGAAFVRAVKKDPVGDLGFVGALISNMLLMGPAFEALGLTEGFNHVAAMGMMESVAALRDADSSKYYDRKLSAYPEGRRKCALREALRTKKKFNLVSANQNARFSFDVEAELAALYEILDMLDELESRKVTTLRFDGKAAVHGILKDARKAMNSKKEAVRCFSAPVRKAV